MSGLTDHQPDEALTEIEERAVALLRAGLTNTAVGNQLYIGRRAAAAIRRRHGIPPVPRSDYCRPPHPRAAEIRMLLEDGHTDAEVNRRTGADPESVARIRTEQRIGPATIAFRWATGRDPVGYVRAECDYHQCVAPDHVDDEPGRTAVREQVRYLLGGAARPEKCKHGHDQAEHGRYEPDGTAYCEACKREIRHRSSMTILHPAGSPA